MQTLENTTMELLVESHHGIYSGQILAQTLGDKLRKVIGEDNFNILLNPEHDDYVEVWADSDSVTITDYEGKKWVLCPIEGDIWAIPEDEYLNINWDEIY